MIYFTWDGKEESIKEAKEPINKKLEPCASESVNFDTTENLYIEGDNIDALKLLMNEYKNKVKMIYIDPPYNTGKNMLYNDKFGDKYCKHTNWLNMMYPRLILARDLLSDDGVIFISIDDNEVANLKKICDEIFGCVNNIDCFIWLNNTTGRQIANTGAVKTYEYVLCYAKNINNIGNFEIEIDFAKKNMPDIYKTFNIDVRQDEYGEYAITNSLANSNRFFNEQTRKNLVFSIFYNPDTKDIRTGNIGDHFDNYIEITPHVNNDGIHKWHAWRWSREKIEKEKYNLIILQQKTTGKYEVYTKIRNFKTTRLKNMITNIKNGNIVLQNTFDSNGIFLYPKPIKLIEIFLRCITNSNDLILDFFSGSATTAHAVMQLNAEDGGKRKFIMVQIPEECDEKTEAYKAGYKNICEIGKERIRRAGKKIKEEFGDKAKDLDIGFRVFKIV